MEDATRDGRVWWELAPNTSDEWRREQGEKEERHAENQQKIAFLETEYRARNEQRAARLPPLASTGAAVDSSRGYLASGSKASRVAALEQAALAPPRPKSRAKTPMNSTPKSRPKTPSWDIDGDEHVGATVGLHDDARAGSGDDDACESPAICIAPGMSSMTAPDGMLVGGAIGGSIGASSTTQPPASRMRTSATLPRLPPSRGGSGPPPPAQPIGSVLKFSHRRGTPVLVVDGLPRDEASTESTPPRSVGSPARRSPSKVRTSTSLPILPAHSSTKLGSKLDAAYSAASVGTKSRMSRAERSARSRRSRVNAGGAPVGATMHAVPSAAPKKHRAPRVREIERRAGAALGSALVLDSNLVHRPNPAAIPTARSPPSMSLRQQLRDVYVHLTLALALTLTLALTRCTFLPDIPPAT